MSPDPDDERLTRIVTGKDQNGEPVELPVVMERAVTLYLNSQEIVTLMTLGDHPRELAVGYLLNQYMLRADDTITDIDYDEDLSVVVVRTDRESNYEHRLKKKIRTSGCAQGTVYGDIMETFEAIQLDENAELKTSWMYELFKRINHCPSLYLKAGAIHGCVLCEADQPLVYMEDVGRHNAVDKIAGYMYLHDISPKNKTFYTTGRLTTEMVIKTVLMHIPILMSRSGFTAAGVELARQANLTLIGRARGKRFTVLSGEQRVNYDIDPEEFAEEGDRWRRKGANKITKRPLPVSEEG